MNTRIDGARSKEITLGDLRPGDAFRCTPSPTDTNIYIKTQGSAKVNNYDVSNIHLNSGAWGFGDKDMVVYSVSAEVVIKP